MQDAVPREILQKILEVGVRAPSGENCQPWRFAVARDGALSVFNIPERDLSLYNFNQLGSMVAHGALIENIAIAATAFGYRAEVELLPAAIGSAASDEHCTAKIFFKKDVDIAEDALSAFISKRASNRIAYQPVPFLAEERERLIAAAPNLVLLEDTQKKKNVAVALSYGDRLLFENEKLHDFLFQHIHWTLAEASIERAGFYIKELALTGPQEAVFKLLRSNAMLRFFNAIGFPKLAAKGNVPLYANSSAFGAIVTQGNSAKDYLGAGRAFERVWLTATALGYSIQPLTTILFFNQRILAGVAEDFSAAQIEGIGYAYAVLEKQFGTEGRTIAMLFRIGKGKPIAHQSLRREPDVVYQ